MPVRRGMGRPSEWIAWEHGPRNLAAWVLALWFAGLLGLVSLRWAASRPDWVVGWRIAAAFLVFTAAVLAGRYVFAGREREPRWLIGLQLGVVAVLLWAVYRSGNAETPFGFGAQPDAVLTGYAVLGLLVLADDPRTYSRLQWVVIACLVVLLVIFFGHAYGISPDSPLAFHPLWAGVLVALWLAVLPRQLPSGMLLWALARVAAMATLLGVLVYTVGPYEWYGLEFRFHSSFTIVGVDREIDAMRSFFINRNSFAVLALAGFFSALVEYLERSRDGASVFGLLGPAMLVVITAVGFFLGYGRWPWALSVIPVVLYFLYLDFGRATIPVSTALSAVYVFGGMVAIWVAWDHGIILDELPTGRYYNWGASVRAIQDNFSLFGAGLVSTAEFIDPYWDRGYSPHNGYLVTWIRFGAVGGLAYLAIVLLGLGRGLWRYRSVDVPMFALALTFAYHQLAEGYTMVDWSIGGAIAAMALGFVVFGEWQVGADTDE